MNVFQFIGEDEDLRTGNKVTQHVKHYDEVPDNKKSFPVYVQVKKDGVYAMVVCMSYGTAIFSRTGKHLKNVAFLEKWLETAKTEQAVYIAELCNDDCSLEQLSGMVNPNRKKPLDDEQEKLMAKSYLAFHDAISITGFKNGYSKMSYLERYSWMMSHLPIDARKLIITLVNSEEEADKYTREAIDLGEEGAVFKQHAAGMSDWQAGHKGYRMMKKVRGVDYDLLCIGVEEGKGKYAGKVANLLFRWKEDKIIKCMLGKGWTHDNAGEMWDNYKYGKMVDSPVGKIFQVYALQESSKGKLRLPKVGELRFDKTESDI